MTSTQVDVVRRAVHVMRTVETRARVVLRLLERAAPQQSDALMFGVALDELRTGADALHALLKSEDDTRPA